MSAGRRIDALELYHRSPATVQDLAATAYGAREALRRHGGAFGRLVEDLEHREWWDDERLVADQSARLRAMVTWCAARVPHYRELFAELSLDPRDIASIEDLSVLPVLDKETVRASPQRFLVDDGPKVIARTTGGTTGTPLQLWATLDALRFNYAAYEARSWRWCGVRRGDRLASFHGQPIVAASVGEPPYWRRNLAFNQLYCSVYHLNERTLPAYVDELARFGPEVITGYPSAVHRVGEHLARTGDVGRIRPSAIILAGETVSPGARADIEAGFGCRVNASYGMGELVAHVAECAEGELHVSTDYGAIELLDLEGSGRTEIVATGLINRGMPLLRYRTGDLASPAASATARCGRGLPCIAELAGRSDDVIITPDGVNVGPSPLSLAFKPVANLRRAQVRQDRCDEVAVLLEVTPDWGSGDDDRLRRELRRRLGERIAIDVQVVDALPRTARGKEQLIVSHLHPNG